GMSDAPPAPGWWKASDGNWYAPQPPAPMTSDTITQVGEALATPSTVDPADPDGRPEDQVVDVGDQVRISGYAATLELAAFAETEAVLVVGFAIENRDDRAQPYNFADVRLQWPDGTVVPIQSVDATTAGSLASGERRLAKLTFATGSLQGDFFVIYRPDAFDEARGVWPISR
ncbi:MAG: hypothetical protein M3Q68_08390, partial [Actinomycetota bacterium]|nr:hypothetical protein [Actinomycetota bacterium]